MGEVREMKPVEERREIVKTAIKIQRGLLPGKTIKDLAKEHGVSRNQIYKYLFYATDDPVEKLRQAEEEVEFRAEVLELMGLKDRNWNDSIRHTSDSRGWDGWDITPPNM
jgi:transposase-like protein